MEVVYYLFFLAIGIGAGFLIGRAENKTAKQAKQLAEELKEAKTQLETHHQQINEHFMKTGELVNNMTESYRAVYQHLASGAQTLCTGEAARIVMRAPSEKLIGGTKDDTAEATPPDEAAHRREASSGNGTGDALGEPVEPRPDGPPAESVNEAVSVGRSAVH